MNHAEMKSFAEDAKEKVKDFGKLAAITTQYQLADMVLELLEQNKRISTGGKDLLDLSIEENEKLQAQLTSAREVIESLEYVEITDGCEECSAIWFRRYGLKAARQWLDENKGGGV